MSKKSEKTKSKAATSKASGFANLFSSHTKVTKASERKGKNEVNTSKKSKDGKMTKQANIQLESSKRKTSSKIEKKLYSHNYFR